MPKAIAIDTGVSNRRRPKTEVEDSGLRSMMLGPFLRHPIDSGAILLAVAIVIAIIVNAMVLQRGRHPSPMFAPAVPFASVPAPVANPLPRPRPVEADAKPAEPARLPAVTPAITSPRPIANSNMIARTDPLGDLITSSRRISSVQRTLAEYGYAQLKATGVMNADTQAAISKFERERKLPVTGQISDRLVRELGILAGRPIE